MLPSFSPMREAFLADEDRVLESLLSIARLEPALMAAVDATARSLVESVRSQQRSNAGMQSFLTQYDLSTQEGVLLMCVAEALLRIPDALTAARATISFTPTRKTVRARTKAIIGWFSRAFQSAASRTGPRGSSSRTWTRTGAPYGPPT